MEPSGSTPKRVSRSSRARASFWPSSSSKSITRRPAFSPDAQSKCAKRFHAGGPHGPGLDRLAVDHAYPCGAHIATHAHAGDIDENRIPAGGLAGLFPLGRTGGEGEAEKRGERENGGATAQ